MLPIKYLTIHCAATPEGRDVNPNTIAQWDKAKFGQESYHWIITLDGAMHRRLADDVRGAHTGGKNTHNIGICYVGGMDKLMHRPRDTRTDAQKKAMLTLVRTYIARYPGIKVLGHRDWPGVRKDCPSFDVENWMIEVGI
jgi:N-acetylmuramoyl-L-alanine amidase